MPEVAGGVAVDVTLERTGDFHEVIFQLSDGQVIVTNSASPNWAALFRSRAHWERATSPLDAIEEYDSIAEAFLAIV